MYIDWVAFVQVCNYSLKCFLHLLLCRSQITTGRFVMCWWICDLVVHASAWMLRNCDDIGTQSQPHYLFQILTWLCPEQWPIFHLYIGHCPEMRQVKGQEVWSQIRMQCMAITSFVPFYALYALYHAAVSPHGPLNQMVDSSTLSAKTVFAYLESTYPDAQVSDGFGFPSPRSITTQGLVLHPPFLVCFLQTSVRTVNPNWVPPA